MATQNNFKVKSGIEIPSLDTFTYTDQTQIPSVQPSLNLDFTTKQLDPRITFSRADAATCATYIDQLGVMKTAAANTPRFDHDPVTGKCLGLLIEESRTNSCTYSNTFSSWTDNGAAAVANAAIAPDGTNTAWTLTDSSTTLYGNIASASSAYTLNEVWCASIYIKKDSTPASTRFCLLRINMGGTSTRYADLTIDTSTGQYATLSYSNGFVDYAGVVDCGDYWRAWLSAHSGTTTTIRMDFYPAVGSAATVNTTYNQVKTGSCVVWGAQLEKGAFPTSYIATTTTAVTRASDYAYMSGTNFSSWFNQAEGTLYANGQKQYSAARFTFYQTISDGTSLNMFRQGTASGGLATYPLLTYNNGNTVYSSNRSMNIGEEIKVVGGYKVNSYCGAVNGTVLPEVTTGTHPYMDRVYFGANYGGTYPICGTIKRIMYYPKRLSNAELTALSIL